MKWIIDRIEEGIAVCEVENEFINVPLSALPSGVKENDIIDLTINYAEKEQRTEKIENLMNNLFKD